MTIDEGIDALELIAQGIEQVQIDCLRRTLDYGLQKAQKRSSGPFSLSELAIMDHPYAVRHGVPMLDPSIINRQTGAFFSAWQSEYSATAGRVVNADRAADFLQYGTDVMFARPVGDAVEAEMRTFAEADLIASLSRVID